MQAVPLQDHLIAAIKKDGVDVVQLVDNLREVARQHKPFGFNTAVRELRERFKSRGRYLVEAELKRRFPETWQEIPVYEGDIVRHVAHADAAVYSGDAPNRWITIDDNEDGAAEEKTKLLNEILERSHWNDKLAAAEMREHPTTRNVIIRVAHDLAASKDAPAARIDLWWGDQVDVLPFWYAPSEVSLAEGIFLDVSGRDTRPRDKAGKLLKTDEQMHWVEFWHREIDIKDGALKTGPWIAERISSRGDVEPVFGTDGVYPLPTLPIVLVQSGEPDAGPWVDCGTVLLNTALAHDVEWSSQLHRLDMNGSPHTFIIGDDDIANKQIVVGPGRHTALSAGASVSPLDVTPSTAGLDTIRAMLQELAVTRQRNRASYDAKSTGAESGTAKRIENREQDRADRKRRLRWQRIEETVLLPLLVEVVDYYFNAQIAHGPRGASMGEAPSRPVPNVAYHVEIPEPADYEEPEVRERRVMTLVDKKYLTKADGLVQMRHFSSTAEAQAYLDEHNLERAQKQEGIPEAIAAAVRPPDLGSAAKPATLDAATGDLEEVLRGGE